MSADMEKCTDLPTRVKVALSVGPDVDPTGIISELHQMNTFLEALKRSKQQTAHRVQQSLVSATEIMKEEFVREHGRLEADWQKDIVPLQQEIRSLAARFGALSDILNNIQKQLTEESKAQLQDHNQIFAAISLMNGDAACIGAENLAKIMKSFVGVANHGERLVYIAREEMIKQDLSITEPPDRDGEVVGCFIVPSCHLSGHKAQAGEEVKLANAETPGNTTLVSSSTFSFQAAMPFVPCKGGAGLEIKPGSNQGNLPNAADESFNGEQLWEELLAESVAAVAERDKESRRENADFVDSECVRSQCSPERTPERISEEDKLVEHQTTPATRSKIDEVQESRKPQFRQEDPSIPNRTSFEKVVPYSEIPLRDDNMKNLAQSQEVSVFAFLPSESSRPESFFVSKHAEVIGTKIKYAPKQSDCPVDNSPFGPAQQLPDRDTAPDGEQQNGTAHCQAVTAATNRRTDAARQACHIFGSLLGANPGQKERGAPRKSVGSGLVDKREMRRSTHHWTLDEIEMLLKGVQEFKLGRWKRISDTYFRNHLHRKAKDLQMKWLRLVSQASTPAGSRKCYVVQPTDETFARIVSANQGMS